jgi:ABC-type transport system involved in multi-copper enzyme maturation permease subunit
MRTLIAIEVEKIIHRRMNQIVLASFTALLIVIYVLLWLASGVVSEVGGDQQQIADLRSALFLEETVPFAILMLNFLGFVSGVVVIGANVGSEYAWNTVRTVTAVEPRRERVLLAKLVALWGVITLALLFGLAVALATSGVITLTAGEFDLSFVDGPYLRESAYSFLRLLVGTAPYFALAFLLGVYGRSATAGIALALGVAIIEGIIGGLLTLSGGWLEELPRYMLDQNADTLALVGGGPFDSVVGQGSPLGGVIDRPGVWHAVTVLALWTTLFLVTSFWAFRRQDLEYQGG